MWVKAAVRPWSRCCNLAASPPRLVRSGGLKLCERAILTQTFRPEPRTQPPRKRRTWLRVLAALGVALLLALALVALWLWKLTFSDLPAMPDAAALWSLNRPPGVTFLDKNGAVLAVRGPRHGQALTLADMPPYLPKAFLAAEDRRFYSHNGVDLVGILRAFEIDLGHGRVVQGGSTITQQIARNIFLNGDQNLRRKLQEAVLAWRIEQIMSKDEILELYLNRTYFGEGAYGVEAAAQTYFGKSAKALNLQESALLAALPKAPSRLDPTNDLDAAVARERVVLGEMRAQGWITAQAQAQAIAAPPVLAPEKPGEGDFGYILDLAAARARDLAGGRAPDLIVELTVDPRLETIAANVVREGVAEGRSQGATQAALVALAPDGAIRALVGGRDHRDSPYDRATQAMRQPGSAFKPFVYAAALENGVRPNDVRTDSPIHYAGWSPENYGGGYSGPTTVADALARSINTVAVRLAHEVGPAKIAELAHRFGLSMIPDQPALPIALGAYEVDLLDLTSGYQVFQNDGKRVESYLITAITTAHGDPIYRHPDVAPVSVYDPTDARQMIRMMEGVLTRGTGKRAAFGRPAAGKTGTSQNWRDAWFVGFTPDWIAGVWVGNDKSLPMNKVAGGELPSEMWRRFMIAAHEGMPVRDFEGLADLDNPPARDQGLNTDIDSLVQTQASSAESEDDPVDIQPSPPSSPQPQRQHGADFYAGLADDLGRAADGHGPP